MKNYKSPLINFMAVLLVIATPLTYAATIWDGPTINFTHSTLTGNLQDQLTPGVKITRGSGSGGLYNSVTETSAALGSPKDTKWAEGSLANFSSLTYSNCPLEAGKHPPGYVGKTFVVHLTNEDIYLSIKLTAWGGAGMTGDRSFSYTRSTPSLTPPTPTISITNPADGTIFAAPANVSIGADAEVSSGTVTNVEFFTNGITAGSVMAPPFNLMINNLAAGAYALTAVATAAGISATSTVVNITVNSSVSSPSVSLTNPASGAVFAAPASINLAADATVSDGAVTNVEFFANDISQGAVTVAPFTLISGPLVAGPYALTAVATASGISATSAVVNVSVVNPMPVNLSNAMANGGQFTFDYTADAGLSYVVQNSSNLVDWVSLATNVAPGNPVLFTNTLSPGDGSFYRVGLLPNP
jgi:Bacterial Ig domain